MSLINKMLQDLDARGGAGVTHASELKPVPPAERDRRPLMLAGGALVAALLVGGGWYGWRQWQDGHQQEVVPAEPAVAIAPAQQSPTQPPTPQVSQTTPTPQTPPPEAPAQAAAPAPASAAPAVEPAPARKVSTPDDAAPRKQARRVLPPVDEPSSAAGVTRDISPQQMAENTYRRALVALQEGRVSNALADLERALDIDPRNDAARQTYISLLLESKRNDDAIRQLRLALGIDPRQPGLAMVLARLQLEKGGPALQTLMDSLPHAGNSAEYRGFLAGVLQREQRHAEAAQYYREALKLSPQNGVWWMGLGISLQAEQHLPEAREAYARARATAGLTPELNAFLDRKLEQLSR